MTGGRLKRVRPYLTPGEPFLMTYGDGVADVDVAQEVAFHKAHGLRATMCAVAPPGRFGSANIEGNKVSSFVEKPTAGNQRINGGFFVLEHDVLDLIDNDDTVWEAEPLESLVAEGSSRPFRTTASGVPWTRCASAPSSTSSGTPAAHHGRCGREWVLGRSPCPRDRAYRLQGGVALPVAGTSRRAGERARAAAGHRACPL